MGVGLGSGRGRGGGRGLRFRRWCRRRKGRECPVEIIDTVDQVFGKAGDGKVLGVLDIALGSFLEVAEVGDGAEVSVLFE